MKRVLWVVLALILIIPAVSFADDAELGSRAITTGTATGAANNNAVITVPASQLIRGRYIRKIVTVPGAGALAPAAYTIVLTDSTGAALFTVPQRSTTAAERYDVPAGISKEEIIDQSWTLTFTGIGSGKTVGYRIIWD